MSDGRKLLLVFRLLAMNDKPLGLGKWILAGRAYKRVYIYGTTYYV
jgi:hypothetical protein